MTLTEILVALMILGLITITILPILKTANRANDRAASYSKQMLKRYQVQQRVSHWIADIAFLDNQLPDIKFTPDTLSINTYDGQFHQLRLVQKKGYWHLGGSAGVNIDLAIHAIDLVEFTSCSLVDSSQQICIEHTQREGRRSPIIMFRILANRSFNCDYDTVGRKCL